MANDGLDKNVKLKIIGILKVLFPKARVILYGSRARGDFHDRSDIDIAIDNGQRTRLAEARSVIEGLHIPYKFDIVDMHHISDEFKKVIQQEGVIWTN
jgi:predicted nucleotidyltransferase